jgi:hypothetical protein
MSFSSMGSGLSRHDVAAVVSVADCAADKGGTVDTAAMAPVAATPLRKSRRSSRASGFLPSFMYIVLLNEKRFSRRDAGVQRKTEKQREKTHGFYFKNIFPFQKIMFLFCYMQFSASLRLRSLRLPAGRKSFLSRQKHYIS